MSANAGYWPSGWDRERYLEAQDHEFAQWSPEEAEHFREGIVADVGEDGRDNLMAERNHRQAQKKKQERRAQGIPAPPSATPNFLTTLRRRRGRGGGFFRLPSDSETPKIEPWGWVVFRTGGYASGDEGRVTEMKERWDQIIHDQLREHEDVEGMDEAIAKLETRWVEGPELDGINIEEVARRYRDLDIPESLRQNLCLMVDNESIDSILDSPLPGDTLRRLRSKIPWCVAVDAFADQRRQQQQEEPEAEGADFKGWFRTAVETLITDLWEVVAGEILDVHHIPLGMEDKDIWCDPYGAGVHKDGVGYFNRRRRY